MECLIAIGEFERPQVNTVFLSSRSDAEDSDVLDTPTPVPSRPSNQESDAPQIQRKTAAESRLEKTVRKTVVDDMLLPEDKPAVARVLRISSPAPQTSVHPPSRPHPTKDDLSSGKDGLTKKQRQNQKKKERHREARAREEAARQEQLRAHQKELETIRLNNQIKKAERKSTTNVWQQSVPASLSDSVYTVRDLSDENLTTIGSDGAGSDEGWQEVTSKGAKRAAYHRVEKTGSSTDRSDELSSKDDNDDVNIPQRVEA